MHSTCTHIIVIISVLCLSLCIYIKSSIISPEILEKIMVVLKSESQRDSFIKRMTKKHTHSHHEGCGCCWYHTSVTRSNNRIILESVSSHAGSVRASAEVLAVLKRRAR